MPDGATKTDGRRCSGPFQRSRLLARPAFLNDVITSFRMLKAPSLVSFLLLATNVFPLTFGFTNPMCYSGLT